MGKLVKYDKTVLVVGGKEVQHHTTAMVEAMNDTQLSWAEHPMSPVNVFTELETFTALTLAKSLFIFGMLRLAPRNAFAFIGYP